MRVAEKLDSKGLMHGYETNEISKYYNLLLPSIGLPVTTNKNPIRNERITKEQQTLCYVYMSNKFMSTFCLFLYIVWGTLLVAQLVEALCYKPEGRGFDSRCCHWNFSLT
jgi:hypothetical protein